MGFLDPNNAPQSTYKADPNALAMQQYGPLIQQAMTNYNNTTGRQNSLVDMLLSPGGGPNLANAQLQQTTQQNNLQGASAIASVRGLNPALAARQMLDTTAAQNQAAAGQASVNRLAQTLDARHQAGDILAQQQGANASMYGTGTSANNAQNQTTVAQQGVNAETANHNADIENQAYKRQADFWQGLIGSGIQAAGSVAGLGALGMGGAGKAPSAPPGTVPSGTPGVYAYRSQGGAIPTLGELLVQGGQVPGRAMMPGNSPRNDVVPAMLSPGEVVIPRTMANNPEAAADFIRALKARGEVR